MTYTRQTRVRPTLILSKAEPAALAPPPPSRSESHHLRIPAVVWASVQLTAIEERRTAANMVVVLLEEALKARMKK